MAQEFDADLHIFSGVKEEAILGAYTRLATPPEEPGEDIGLDFNPHLPPWPVASKRATDSVIDATELPNLPDTPFTSPRVAIAHRRTPSPLVLAVDAAADGLEGQSHIPDSPLNLTQFELGGRPSFDTSVRDLVQSRPDSPIGGQAAAPMAPTKPKRSFNVGTLVTQGRLPPRIEISCADDEPCCEDDMNKPPKSRSRASESQGSENLPPRSETQTGSVGNTPSMVTAPESPRVHCRTDNSDGINDIDDRRLTVTDVRDFALTTDGSRSKKASKVPDPEPAPASTQNDLDPYFCEDCVSPMTIAPKNAPPKIPSKLDTKASSDPSAPGSNAAGKIEKDTKTEKSAKAGKAVPAGVLTDGTGLLTAPGTPKPKKRKVLIAKGQVVIRKCRGAVFRTPVMTVVVGRQLGPSTSQALKLISKGIPIEPPKIVPTTPVPLPVPV